MKEHWKRIFAALFSGCALALAGLGLAACADGDKGDAHSFGNWETAREATCASAGRRSANASFAERSRRGKFRPWDTPSSRRSRRRPAPRTAFGRSAVPAAEKARARRSSPRSDTTTPRPSSRPPARSADIRSIAANGAATITRATLSTRRGTTTPRPSSPPTCTEPGYTAYLCTRCGDSYREETAGEGALGHDADEYGFCRRCHIVSGATKVLYSPSSESSLKAACYIKEIEEGSGEYRAIFASPERVCPDRVDLSAFNVTELVFAGDVKEVQSDGISDLNDSPSVVRAVFGDGVETVCPSFWNYPNLSEISVGKGCETLYVTGYVQGGRTLTIRYGGTSDEWAEKVKILGSLSVSELYIGGEKPTELHLNCANINDYAFSGLTQIQSVTFGENVRKIGKYAFYNCTSLSRIAFGEGVREIGDYAFYRQAFAREKN